jgi:threonine dehydrogenase-like Zn-dependent dehydrogenase
VQQLVTKAPRSLGFRQVDEPTAAAGEALIDVEAVGICGSDIHLYTGDHPYSHFPNVQGHEFGGRIRALPEGYSGPFRLGQRVAVEPLLMCGHCLPCRRGRGNCCVNMRTYGAHIDGALSERIAVPVGLLYDADDLTPELAALVEPISIGVHAVARSGIGSADQAVVYGAGPIGQAILLAAADLGARLLVVDRLPARLALATELGAERTVDTGRESADDVIAEWTGGEGPVVVFEATGVPRVLEAAIGAVAPSGTVVVVGLSNEPVSIPMVTFTRKELTVVGSRNNMGQFGRAADLVRRNRTQAERLISHRFAFADAPSAFELALNEPSTTEKVIIRVGEGA